MVKRLELAVINDNEPGPGLMNEWGWSILASSDMWRILFDADTRPEVIRYNLGKMGVDPREIDFSFLSHYHADHYGGFEFIGEANPGMKVYVPPGEPSLIRDFGLDPVVVNEGKMIDTDVWASGPLGMIGEQALGIKVDGLGLVVIVGCSHPGVDSLTRRLAELTGENIYLTIGGFHLPSRQVIDELASLSQYISPAHCSGNEAKGYVRSKYPDKFLHVRTGDRLIVDARGIRRIA